MGDDTVVIGGLEVQRHVLSLAYALGLALFAGFVGACFKYWFDNRREQNRREEVLLRWILSIRRLRKTIYTQVRFLRNYSEALVRGDQPDALLVVSIGVQMRYCDEFRSRDLYAPIRSKVYGRRFMLRRYQVESADRLALNAYMNVMYGRTLCDELLSIKDVFFKERQSLTQEISESFHSFRSFVGSAIFRIEPFPAQETLQPLLELYFQDHLTGLENGPRLLQEMEQRVRTFWEIFLPWREHPVIAPMEVVLGDIMRLLSKLEYRSEFTSSQLSALALRYEAYNRDLGSWLVAVNA